MEFLKLIRIYNCKGIIKLSDSLKHYLKNPRFKNKKNLLIEINIRFFDYTIKDKVYYDYTFDVSIYKKYLQNKTLIISKEIIDLIIDDNLVNSKDLRMCLELISNEFFKSKVEFKMESLPRNYLSKMTHLLIFERGD